MHGIWGLGLWLLVFFGVGVLAWGNAAKLVQAFRWGRVRTGLVAGATVYRSIEPRRFWSVVTWSAIKAAFFSLVLAIKAVALGIWIAGMISK
jgi:hypothetical protein